LPRAELIAQTHSLLAAEEQERRRRPCWSSTKRTCDVGHNRLSQLRYDLSKLRAKSLVERIGKSRRYRLTPLGLKLGVQLVKLRTRLLGHSRA